MTRVPFDGNTSPFPPRRGWRDGDMRRRWIGLGLRRAAERFRRIKRHGDLGVLVTALGTAITSERAA
jgi:hypothetical protein